MAERFIYIDTPVQLDRAATAGATKSVGVILTPTGQTVAHDGIRYSYTGVNRLVVLIVRTGRPLTEMDRQPGAVWRCLIGYDSGETAALVLPARVGREHTKISVLSIYAPGEFSIESSDATISQVWDDPRTPRPLVEEADVARSSDALSDWLEDE